MKMKEPKLETWNLTDLHSHPSQDTLFLKPTAKEIERLAQDIAANGLQVPLDVLPDGTLLRGHSRCLALELLGEAQVTVNVRYDLAEASEQEQLNFLIDDNLHRRQLSPVEIARCAIAKIGQLQALDGSGKRRIKGKLKEQVAAELGMSKRNLNVTVHAPVSDGAG